MWKRERPERVNPDEALAEQFAKPPHAARPVLPSAPAAQPTTPMATQPAVHLESASTPHAAPSPSPQQASAAARASTFGASLRFKGDLVADEDLVVEGQVEGSILHTRCLTIGAPGSMRGDIRARRIVVEGTVDGNLYALESVVMRPGSTVRGDVFAPRVSIEEGARLSGRIDMDKAPSVPKVAARPGGPAETPRELSTQEVSEILARP